MTYRPTMAEAQASTVQAATTSPCRRIVARSQSARPSSSLWLAWQKFRGVEVLLLSDQVDAFWPERLDHFDDKPIRSITQGRRAQ